MRLLQCFCVALGLSYLGFFTPLRFIFLSPLDYSRCNKHLLLISWFHSSLLFHIFTCENSFSCNTAKYTYRINQDVSCWPFSHHHDVLNSPHHAICCWASKMKGMKKVRGNSSILHQQFLRDLLRLFHCISSRFSSTTWKFTRFCSHSSLRNSNQERKNCKCMQQKSLDELRRDMRVWRGFVCSRKQKRQIT